MLTKSLKLAPSHQQKKMTSPFT